MCHFSGIVPPSFIAQWNELRDDPDVAERTPPLTADEAYERRKAERRLQLMAIHEEIAIFAITADTDHLRRAYANRYRNLIGVRPEQRQEFRESLLKRENVSVDELIEHFLKCNLNP